VGDLIGGTEEMVAIQLVVTTWLRKEAMKEILVTM
jgi:hypothetical protein